MRKKPATFARSFLIAALLLGLSAATLAAPPDPARVPQRVLLGISDDPAHSQSVTWRTSTPVDAPQGQIAPWSGNPGFGKDPKSTPGKTATYPTGAGPTVTHYEAVFSGLEPNKEYGYRVGDGATWSEWFHIRTASDKSAPFRFIFLGDAQVDVKSLWSRAAHAAFMQAPDARLILQAGDLINNGFDDALWGEWCDGMGFVGAMVPNLPAVGNHDMNLPKGSPTQPTAAYPLWKAHFALPQNGPKDAPMLEDEAYWVDYQGVRFICFEGNAYALENYDPDARKLVQKKQVEWVEPLLANNPNRWTIMLHHEPMYGVGKNPDNPELREAFLPLYDKYHVDLALQGHDHTYARSRKLAGGKIVDPSAQGTVYVVAVSGPKMYPFNPTYQDLMAKTVTDTQTYQIVSVDNDALRLETYSVGGEWVDGFELRKDNAGHSTLVDLPGAEKK